MDEKSQPQKSSQAVAKMSQKSQRNRSAPLGKVRPNGEKVRLLRTRDDMTQEQLAATAKIAKRTIETIEKGVPVLRSSLALVARALRTKTSFLEASEQIALLVLPLKNNSIEPEYLVDGLTSTLINGIGRLDSINVMSQFTSMQLKAHAGSLDTIARQLGVDYVVEGFVVSVDNELLRVTLTLRDACYEEVRWGNSYSDTRSNIIDVVERTAVRELAGSFGIQLSAAEEKRLSKEHQINPNAYIDYHTGRHHWARLSAERLRKAITYFEAAIDKDPNWALPYTGIADSYNLLALGGFVPPSEAMPEAKSAAFRALSIDPDSPEAHTPLAAASAYFDWDWSGAETRLKRTIKANPRYQTAHHVYAMACLMPQGRFEEAIVEISLAQQNDPLSPFVAACVGITQYYARAWNDAIDGFRRALELQPKYHLALWHLGWTYQAMGMKEEALGNLERAAEQSQNAPQAMGALGNCYGLFGRTGDAERILNELKKRSTSEFVSPYDLLLVFLGLGQIEKALDCLELAAKERTPAVARINVHPLFDRIKSEPRFLSVVRQMKL